MATANVPATSTGHAVAKKDEQTKLITILKNDFKYDIVKEIIDHIKMIKRAKKIKPLEKHRLLYNYNVTLLSYCMPKMKIVEDNTDNGKPMNFTINIGGDADTQPAPKKAGKGGVSITIPTKKTKDGSYSVSGD
jgi:hypothetical protein